MVANINTEVLPLEMERLKTSIKYHDWFLGFVVVVGVTLSVYLVSSMNHLKDGLHGVHIELQKIHTKFEPLDQKVDRLEQKADRTDRKLDRLEQKADRTDRKLDRMDRKMDRLEQKVDRMDRKMDSYPGGSGNPGS